MSEIATIARPYARAAFDLALEHGELNEWASMLTFASEVARNERVKSLLNGLHSVPEQTEIMISLCGEQLNQFGQNLIKVMAENARLAALPEVCHQFMVFRHEYEKCLDVEVISAIALKKAQQDEITRKLETRFERKIKLNCSVDETLIAGVVIRAGDLVIDNSVSGRMRRLSETLQS